MQPEAGSRFKTLARWLGPLCAVIIWSAPAPASLNSAGWIVVGLAIWMVVWWLSEALPLAVTALLPFIVLPVAGVQRLDTVAGSYADPLIFLFLGGFMLAAAMQSTGLTRVLAVLVLRAESLSARAAVGLTMLITALCSMFVSNTATAMMMLPIAKSIAHVFEYQQTPATGQFEHDTGGGGTPATALTRFNTCLLLGVAYAATIGGIGSLIGTPPNALFAAYMREAYDFEVTFILWLAIGVPVVCVFLPVAWWLLTTVLFPLKLAPVSRSQIRDAFEAQDLELNATHKRLLVIVSLVALGWVLRPFIVKLWPALQISDAAIALAGAVCLFIVPRSQPQDRESRSDLKQSPVQILDWQTAATIRWDVLILFGGGLALADALIATDLAQWLSTVAIPEQLPAILLVVALLTVTVIAVGELASNTAMAAVFLPVAGAMAVTYGLSPWAVVLPVALAATVGFMLPVATPPNAIVYGSAMVPARDMMRAGVILDLIGMALVIALSAILLWWFG